MSRKRRDFGPLGQNWLEMELINISLRNMMINYELNQEWEELNQEIWVCLAIISLFDSNNDSLLTSTTSRVKYARNNRPYSPYAERSKSQAIVDVKSR